MKNFWFSTVAIVATVILFTACGNSNVANSPLNKRGTATGTGTNGLQPAGTGTTPATSSGNITGSFGKLTVSNVTASTSGGSLTASYINSVGITLNISLSLQAGDLSGEKFDKDLSEKNWSYAYFEGRCATYYTSSPCEVAYFAVYIVDYDAAGTYVKTTNFSIEKPANGNADIRLSTKTSSYLSVAEVEQMYLTVTP